MGVLDRKLLRDLWRLKAQVISIALVMAAGIATLVLGVATYQSLTETQAAYYERQRFADLFAEVGRAPERIAAQIAAVPGVATVDTRIVESAVLDVAGMAEPAVARLISLPDAGEPLHNALHMRLGRLPDPDRPDEIVVNQGFAAAHGLTLGDGLAAVVNGRQRVFEVVGVAISPEFIYNLPPGAMMADERRYAVVWMSRRALASAFDLEGAFSAVSVRLIAGASEAGAIERIDDLLERYGGRGAYGRDEQQSHALLDAELQGLQATSAVLPPIFLFVAAFLVNLTMTRLIALEREQIGLMKALGYGTAAVAWHYLKFVAALGALGVAVGLAFGAGLGRGLADLYAGIFDFPFLVFRIDTGVYLLAAGATLAAAMLGAGRAVWGVVGLSPAVAMQPAPPPRYRRVIGGGHLMRLPQTSVMIVRNIARWPLRAAFTTLGIAFTVAILVASLFIEDAVEHLIEVTYFQSERQDATLGFAGPRPAAVLADVARLPGVLAAEPIRIVPARLSHGHLSQRVAIEGRLPSADLSRLIDIDGRPAAMPGHGLVLGDFLADTLGVRVGDVIGVEPLEGRPIRAELPVSDIVSSYVGVGGYMALDQLNRLMREGPMISGVHLGLDPLLHGELYEATKAMPAIASIGMQSLALEGLRESIAESILIMVGVLTVLALVIAFGVVYNSARIQLSERGRELASLRVLGFTRAEVSWILLAELALLTVLALPLGWVLGYGLAAAMVVGFETELFRIPLVVTPRSYALAAIIVVVAAFVSALVVRRRIDRLDLIEVLKTRE